MKETTTKLKNIFLDNLIEIYNHPPKGGLCTGICDMAVKVAYDYRLLNENSYSGYKSRQVNELFHSIIPEIGILREILFPEVGPYYSIELFKGFWWSNRDMKGQKSRRDFLMDVRRYVNEKENSKGENKFEFSVEHKLSILARVEGILRRSHVDADIGGAFEEVMDPPFFLDRHLHGTQMTAYIFRILIPELGDIKDENFPDKKMSSEWFPGNNRHGRAEFIKETQERIVKKMGSEFHVSPSDRVRIMDNTWRYFEALRMNGNGLTLENNMGEVSLFKHLKKLSTHFGYSVNVSDSFLIYGMFPEIGRVKERMRINGLSKSDYNSTEAALRAWTTVLKESVFNVFDDDYGKKDFDFRKGILNFSRAYKKPCYHSAQEAEQFLYSLKETFDRSPSMLLEEAIAFVAQQRDLASSESVLYATHYVTKKVSRELGTSMDNNRSASFGHPDHIAKVIDEAIQLHYQRFELHYQMFGGPKKKDYSENFPSTDTKELIEKLDKQQWQESKGTLYLAFYLNISHLRDKEKRRQYINTMKKRVEEDLDGGDKDVIVTVIPIEKGDTRMDVIYPHSETTSEEKKGINFFMNVKGLREKVDRYCDEARTYVNRGCKGKIIGTGIVNSRSEYNNMGDKEVSSAHHSVFILCYFDYFIPDYLPHYEAEYIESEMIKRIIEKRRKYDFRYRWLKEEELYNSCKRFLVEIEAKYNPVSGEFF